jgi:hypothetical protein
MSAGHASQYAARVLVMGDERLGFERTGAQYLKVVWRHAADATCVHHLS